MVWRQGEKAMKGIPSANKFMQWFDPRGRSAGSWGFIINRITGLGLLLYLLLHLIVLYQLTQGAAAYDGFVTMMKNPVFILGELLVIAAGILHGINGIRIGLTSFGIAVRYQFLMLLIVTVLSVSGIVFFAFRMLGGA
jgi:succinate dehydrogenase / fumarate reductase, cytochrome b subunit